MPECAGAGVGGSVTEMRNLNHSIERVNFITYGSVMVGIPTSALDDVARRFSLLGDPTRLRILGALHQAGEASVGDVAEAAGVSLANASQHLGRLALGGIVGRRHVGRSVVYRIIEPAIEQLCAIVCASLDVQQTTSQPDTDAHVS